MPVRKDKTPVPKTTISVRMPLTMVEALNRMADNRMTNRNALIVAALTRLVTTKRKAQS